MKRLFSDYDGLCRAPESILNESKKALEWKRRALLQANSWQTPADASRPKDVLTQVPNKLYFI